MSIYVQIICVDVQLCKLVYHFESVVVRPSTFSCYTKGGDRFTESTLELSKKNTRLNVNWVDSVATLG